MCGVSSLLHRSLCDSVPVSVNDESAVWTQCANKERHCKHFCLPLQQQQIYSFNVSALLSNRAPPFPQRGTAGAGSHFSIHIHPQGVCAGWGHGTASSSGAATGSGRMQADHLLNQVGNEQKYPSGAWHVFFKYLPSPEDAQEVPGLRWAVWRGEEVQPRAQSQIWGAGKSLPALLAGVSLETGPNTPTGPLRAVFSPVSRFAPVMSSRQNS